MKIAISAVLYGEYAGAAKHLENLLAQWTLNDIGHQIVIFATEFLKEKYQKYGNSYISIQEVRGLQSNPILGIQWNLLVLPILLKRHRFDRLLLPFNAFVPCNRWHGCLTLAVVRDLGEFVYENKYDQLRMAYRKTFMMPRTLKSADRIIFISKSTLRDANKYLSYKGNNNRIIYHGRSTEFRRINRNHIFLEKYCITENRYFVTVGRLDPVGKNLIKLLGAFEIFMYKAGIQEFKCVLVGTDWRNTRELRDFLETYKWRNNIILTGYINKQELIGLYSGALSLVFPSIYEGFGHPIIEAMSCGCPVICSNISSLPEVGGNAALFFNPHDIIDISDAMLKVLRDKKLRESLIKKGYENIQRFSWEKTAKHTMNYILE